jgi:hypothetical protein
MLTPVSDEKNEFRSPAWCRVHVSSRITTVEIEFGLARSTSLTLGEVIRRCEARGYTWMHFLIEQGLGGQAKYAGRAALPAVT